MTERRYLGDRASLLLGLLGKPMTVRELYDLVVRAKGIADSSETDDAFRGVLRPTTVNDAGAALAELAGGTHVVRRELERLEAANYVRRQTGVTDHDAQLWWRA